MVKVGDVFIVERRFAWQGDHVRPQHVNERAVMKVTPKRAYFDALTWFALDDPRREVKPKYLDYRSIAIPKEEPAASSD